MFSLVAHRGGWFLAGCFLLSGLGQGQGQERGLKSQGSGAAQSLPCVFWVNPCDVEKRNNTVISEFLPVLVGAEGL